MEIRHTREEDLPRLMEIYAHARRFMAEHDNPTQWGSAWPPEELIRNDVATGRGYACEQDGRIVGTFFFTCGEDVEPTYASIEDGAWISDEPYGVVHRIASDGSVPGTGSFCIDWAFAQCGHLRIDTHADNYVMQGLLEKLGFVRCGTIYVWDDGTRSPRVAFERCASV
ncbi:MAG: GNAT family N-acetyltransferase [Olsenella sp.]